MSPSLLGAGAATLRPRQRDGVLSYCAAEEIVLYDRQTNVAVALNLTAAAIWDLCDGSNSVRDIIADLALAVGDATRVVPTDVERALNELHALDLLILQSEDVLPLSATP